LAKGDSSRWILEGDIKGCFDNISHQWILGHVQTNKVILQKWLKAGFVYKKQLFPTEAGTPQRGIISPALVNRTLDGLQTALSKRFFKTRRNGKAYIPKPAKPEPKRVKYLSVTSLLRGFDHGNITDRTL